LIVLAASGPRRVKRVHPKHRFPRARWHAKYAGLVEPELADRARILVAGAWDAGLIHELWDLHHPAESARVLNATVRTPEEDDDWLKKHLSKLAKKHELNLDKTVEKMTGQIWQAGSRDSFRKLGVQMVWSLKSPAVEQAIKDRQNQVKGCNASQFDRIRSLIRNQVYDQGGSAISTKFLTDLQKVAKRESQYGAEVIARTETASVLGSGSFTVYERNGVERLGWFYSQSGYDRHAPLDGEEVPIGDTFSNGCRFPGDPAGEAGEVVNCLCDQYPVIDSAIEPDEVVSE
jgi:hypothetical protein